MLFKSASTLGLLHNLLNMSRNIVFEGWLTKSPPSKRIWRTKWRRRWFALRQSGELPGQYFLDYYADRNCRRLKGTINLDLCEQVDAGLHMERAGNGTLDPKLRGSVFTIQTQSRTYHLEADCEAEMAKWVDAICRVCGLRPTEDEDAYQYNASNKTVTRVPNSENAAETGPYIPISECITGVRDQEQETTFTFDTKNAVTQKTTCDKASSPLEHIYINPPRIKITDCSENESYISEDDCPSLNANQSKTQDWSVTKTFTKLAVNPNRKGTEGPPVPPRPPKTFAKPKYTIQRQIPQAAMIQEPVVPVQANNANYTGPGTPCLNIAGRQAAPRSPKRTLPMIPNTRRTPPSNARRVSASNTLRSSDRHTLRYTDDEDDNFSTRQSRMSYHNMPPPAVDRGLKPRYSSHNNEPEQYELNGFSMSQDEKSSHKLLYLDLDLPMSTLPASTDSDVPRNSVIIHGKSKSADEPESDYKMVDFVKTEAFNSTRQDAEAHRLFQC